MSVDNSSGSVAKFGELDTGGPLCEPALPLSKCDRGVVGRMLATSESAGHGDWQLVTVGRIGAPALPEGRSRRRQK